MRKRTQKKRKQFSKKQRKLRLSKKQRKLRLSKKRGQKKMRGGRVLNLKNCNMVEEIYHNNTGCHPSESPTSCDKRKSRLRNAYEGACCILVDPEQGDWNPDNKATCQKLHDEKINDIISTIGKEHINSSYIGPPNPPASQPETPPSLNITPVNLQPRPPPPPSPATTTRPPQRRQPPKPVPNKDCYDRCANQCSIKCSDIKTEHRI